MIHQVRHVQFGEMLKFEHEHIQALAVQKLFNVAFAAWFSSV